MIYASYNNEQRLIKKYIEETHYSNPNWGFYGTEKYIGNVQSINTINKSTKDTFFKT